MGSSGTLIPVAVGGVQGNSFMNLASSESQDECKGRLGKASSLLAVSIG